jgi:hypothetical protein
VSQTRLIPPRPTPLEIASGGIFGLEPLESAPAADPWSPIEALERAILPALRRGPCLVGFSGSPASTALLALAVRLARREGLELPLPATVSVGGGDRQRRERQCDTLIALGLTDWARFELEDELELVGPVAMSVLRRHGLVAPFHLYRQMPLIVEALGGSLIVADIDAGQSGARSSFAWLRPDAAAEVGAAWLHEAATMPQLWSDRIAWMRRRRAVRTEAAWLAHLAAELRVEVVNPFLDAEFALALLRRPAAGLAQLFADLLPSRHLEAPECLPGACWGERARELAVSWDEDDVDPALVDCDALALEWAREQPDERTFLLLQSAAVAREGRSVARQLAQAVGGLV